MFQQLRDTGSQGHVGGPSGGKVRSRTPFAPRGRGSAGSVHSEEETAGPDAASRYSVEAKPPPHDTIAAETRGLLPHASLRGSQAGVDLRDDTGADVGRESLTPSIPEPEFYSAAEILHRVKELTSRIPLGRDDGTLLRDVHSLLTKRQMHLDAEADAAVALKAQEIRAAWAHPAPGTGLPLPTHGQATATPSATEPDAALGAGQASRAITQNEDIGQSGTIAQGDTTGKDNSAATSPTPPEATAGPLDTAVKLLDLQATRPPRPSWDDWSLEDQESLRKDLVMSIELKKSRMTAAPSDQPPTSPAATNEVEAAAPQPRPTLYKRFMNSLP